MAFRRIEDFKAVHDGEEDVSAPFTILRESLGITKDTVHTLYELAENLFVDDVTEDHMLSGVLFGLIVGLIASDYASET